jgi:hypothetical protein
VRFVVTDLAAFVRQRSGRRDTEASEAAQGVGLSASVV